MLETIQSALGTRQTPTLDLNVDRTLTLLSNSRRRQVIERVATAPDAIALGQLTEAIAADEEGVSREVVSRQAYKRVYVGLYQTHLPKMDAAGLVDFDEDASEVAGTWRTQPALDLAETVAAAHGGDA